MMPKKALVESPYNTLFVSEVPRSVNGDDVVREVGFQKNRPQYLRAHGAIHPADPLGVR